MIRLARKHIIMMIPTYLVFQAIESKIVIEPARNQSDVVSSMIAPESSNSTGTDVLANEVKKQPQKTIDLIPRNVRREQIQLYLAVHRHRASVHKRIRKLVRDAEGNDFMDGMKELFLEITQMKALEMAFINSIRKRDAEDGQVAKNNAV